VDQTPSEPVSQLLGEWAAVDSDTLRALVPLVYADLRRLAHHYLQRQQPHHTLQSTALVHEAYLRLANHEKMRFESRAHFFAVAARIMRQILVDHVRNKQAAKRDAGIMLVLDDTIATPRVRQFELMALDHALQELTQLDSRMSQIVELRFFGGLSIEETSEVLHISTATVKREWTTARLWLRRQLAQGMRA